MSRRAPRSPVGGLGARYGRSVRRRVATVEAEAHQRYPCPNCGSVAVERMSVGVWKCGKCGNTFTGGAYSPTTKTGEVARRSSG